MVEAVPGNAGRADYPRMLYHPDGRFLVVQNPEQHQAQLEKGFSQNPQPQHQQRPVTSHEMGISDPLIAVLRSAVEQVLDARGMTKEWVRANTPAPVTEVPQLELPSSRRN